MSARKIAINDCLISFSALKMVDINNRTDIFKRLENLKVNAVPAFGIFTPQHMVEHLSDVVMLSNGKQPVQLCYPEHEAALLKENLIYSDNDFPMDFKAPLMGDNLPELELPDLQTAIEKLKTELNDFDRYFVKHEFSKPVNPIMGALDKDEWVIFHNKHFTHHFKQFNLL